MVVQRAIDGLPVPGPCRRGYWMHLIQSHQRCYSRTQGPVRYSTGLRNLRKAKVPVRWMLLLRTVMDWAHYRQRHCCLLW